MSRRLVFIVCITLGVPLTAAAAQSLETPEARQTLCRKVDEAATANRLSPALLTRLLWHESRLQGDATSPVGAEGVAQFMPRTAFERGLRDPRSTDSAIAEAARFLAELTARFGNIGLAAAAYNAGAGRVAKWQHAQLTLPGETLRYVFAVTGHRAEEWLDRGGSEQINGGDPRPCLEVVNDLLRSTSQSARWLAWRARLDRVLSRASVLASVMSRQNRIDTDVTGLCASIRSLGARCEIYQH